MVTAGFVRKVVWPPSNPSFHPRFSLAPPLRPPNAAHKAELVASIDSTKAQSEDYSEQVAEPRCDGEKKPDTNPKS